MEVKGKFICAYIGENMVDAVASCWFVRGEGCCLEQEYLAVQYPPTELLAIPAQAKGMFPHIISLWLISNF